MRKPTKTLAVSIASITLALNICSVGNAQITPQEKMAMAPAAVAGALPVDPSNSFIAVQVGADGKFNIGAFQPALWDILYSWPDTPWSSFSTVRIDGTDNLYGSSGAPVQPPVDTDPVSNVSSWLIGDILVTQTLQIVTAGSSTGNPDVVKIQYDVHNGGQVTHQVGLRIMLDVEINYNDGAPYRIPTLADAITTETELLAPNIPPYYQAFFDLNDATHVAQGTLTGAGATTPDRFIMVQWPGIVSTLFDYNVTPGLGITSDSAVGLYWFATDLAPGQQKTYVTYYGLGGLSGNSSLSISGPAQLETADCQWTPNPFTVVAYLQNNTGTTISGDSLTISFPGSSGIALAAGESATHSLSDIAPGQTAQTSWNVSALTTGTWTYQVDDTTGLTASKTIVVPDLTGCGECSGVSLSCPVAIPACTDPGACGAVVTYPDPVLSAACPGATVSCSPVSGSFFNAGSTPVSCALKDANGSVLATCGFDVTVNDCIPPTITCPAPVEVCNDSGLCTAKVFGLDPIVSDNCQGAITVAYALSGATEGTGNDCACGTTFNNGVTTITYTATDASGNSASCSFTVTINDCEAPTVQCVATTNPDGDNTPNAGKNAKSGQNPDGFYQLLGSDNCGQVTLFVKDSVSGFVAGPFKNGDKVKIVQAPNVIPSQAPMDGVIVAMIKIKGDAVAVAVDGSRKTAQCSCLVPPKPK